MKSTNKIIKTSTMLIRYFIFYSLLAVLAYSVAYSVFTALFATFTLSDTQSYFAIAKDSEEYPEIDQDRIIAAGGCVVILDESGDIVEGGIFDGVKHFSIKDIADLVSGKYKYNGTLYFATIANIRKVNEYLTIVAILPSDKVEATYYIENISSMEAKSFIIVLTMSVAIFVFLYLLITLIVAKRLNNRIVSPILAITRALEDLNTEEYNISLDLKAKNEFVFIKNAFDLMLQRLRDGEIQRKEHQKEKMKLLSDIGHDLRTPITVISGLLQALLSGKVNYEKTANEYIETIYKNTKLLSDLVELQLDYTLWDRKDYRPLMVKQNLSECIRDVIITNYALCDEEDIELEIDIPESDVFCEMDSGQLRRAFSNLLTNAIFHNSGISYMKIGISLCVEQNTVKIIFADTGSPIPEEIKKSILSTTPLRERHNRGAGHGLGLSITQRIVELHGGNLYLEEKYNNYTKAFIITLTISKK